MAATLTERQMQRLRLDMSRRAVLAGGLNVVVFLAFYHGAPFTTGRPAGSDAAFVALLAGAALRAAVHSAARKHGHDPAWAPRIVLSFRAAMMLGAVTWGLFAVPTVHEYGLAPPSFILLTILLGIALLAVPSFGLDLPLVRAFVVTITVPAAVTTALRPDPGALTVGLCYVVWTAFLVFISGQAHATLTEALTSRSTIQGHRDQLSAVLDAFPGVVLWIDGAGKVLGANDRLARMFGQVPATCIGRPFDDVVTDARLVDVIRRFVAGAALENVDEIPLAGRNGARATLLALRKYGDGAHPKLLVTGLDVEDRKRAETERDQARASAYGSSQLAELGIMAAGIAHEINNPLQALSYSLDLLKQHLETPSLSREQLTSKALRIVDRGSTTVQRIASIVQTLRAFAREDRDAPFETVDVRDVVRELEELGASLVAAEGIELCVDLGPGDLTVRARRIQLGQVLLNLVNNARDAVRTAAEKRIDIRARAVPDAVELCVEDSGPGVPAAVRDQIMVPFFTTKDAGRGTGLGLSISTAIVEQHEGRLYLDTESSRTRFVLRLPRAAQKRST